MCIGTAPWIPAGGDRPEAPANTNISQEVFPTHWDATGTGQEGKENQESGEGLLSAFCGDAGTARNAPSSCKIIFHCLKCLPLCPAEGLPCASLQAALPSQLLGQLWPLPFPCCCSCVAFLLAVHLKSPIAQELPPASPSLFPPHLF